MNETWLQTLNTLGAQFNEGRVASYSSIGHELAASTEGTVFCDLSHDGLIVVSGDDAVAFLQGQFSNDVAALTTTSAQWNSWSSPKGRMLATFLMWRQHDENSDNSSENIYLQLPRSLQAAIQKRLSMFVLRSKVKLTDASDTLIKIGIADRDAKRLQAQLEASIGAAFGGIADISFTPMQTVETPPGSLKARLVCLSPNRFEIMTPLENAVEIWQKLSTVAKPVGALVWDGFAVRDGIITVLPETQDAFVAQMANFELIGGVNFKKGCYVGQEIIARTQYRGILKRRMALTHLEATTAPQPGDKVYSEKFGDQACGISPG